MAHSLRCFWGGWLWPRWESPGPGATQSLARVARFEPKVHVLVCYYGEKKVWELGACGHSPLPSRMQLLPFKGRLVAHTFLCREPCPVFSVVPLFPCALPCNRKQALHGERKEDCPRAGRDCVRPCLLPRTYPPSNATHPTASRGMLSPSDRIVSLFLLQGRPQAMRSARHRNVHG